MPACNTATRPLPRHPVLPAPVSIDHFASLGFQAEIMAERRTARFFTTTQLRTLAASCHAKAARARARVGARG